MMRFAAALLIPALGACATSASDGTAPAMPSIGGRCDAAPAQDMVGQPATAELGADVQRRTGANAFRWLQPGQIVTMEFRDGRVNVHLDEQNKVRSINCG
ncbi:I78 family peptidase inhibitor [Allosphingosinicella vermicomposti]|uniref:I78 family peptidase inhibitor n=1 Tax=Allosphingosinicella vermicomposti TaxID=614671 RepID=UPI000D0E9739|nr:I78 family peptidase inhibitor [Allosphingosinicella vermicomposti]